MTVEEFEEMLVGDFFLKLFYFNEAREESNRYIGELLRVQTMHLLNVQIESKHRFKKPQELWKFGWEDEEHVSEELTDEQIEDKIKNLQDVAERYL